MAGPGSFLCGLSASVVNNAKAQRTQRVKAASQGARTALSACSLSDSRTKLSALLTLHRSLRKNSKIAVQSFGTASTDAQFPRYGFTSTTLLLVRLHASALNSGFRCKHTPLAFLLLREVFSRKVRRSRGCPTRLCWVDKRNVRLAAKRPWIGRRDHRR